MHLLFQTILQLDRKEMTRFKDFALSPYFNKHQGVRALVGYLSGIYPQITNKNCDVDVLAAVISPEGQTKHSKGVAVVLTYAWRLLQKFLEIERFQADDRRADIHLLQQLRQKKQQSFLFQNPGQTACRAGRIAFSRQLVLLPTIFIGSGSRPAIWPTGFRPGIRPMFCRTNRAFWMPFTFRKN